VGRGGQFAAALRIRPAEIVPTEQISREYDPYLAGTTEDPYAEYRWLRDEHPLYYSERYGIYAVSRYDDVSAVSRDWETFTSAKGVDVDDTALLGGPNVLETDPPEHLWWRRLFQRRFAAKAIREELTPVIEAEVRRLLDLALEGDPEETDLGTEFAWKLPIVVTGHMVGVPREDQRRISDNLQVFQEREPGETVPPKKSEDAAADIHEYLSGLIEEKRSNPRDDLISLMVTAERDGEPLPEDQIIGNTYLLLDAGTHTTSSLISHGLTQLDWHRDQREWLAANPGEMPDAVEEIIRYDSPLRVIKRVAVRESTLHGETVPEGASVFMLYCAANRDERRWSDPDEFDIRRKPQRTMAFGDGIHHCIGAPIARFEAEIALRAVLARIPDYELNGPLVRIRSHMMNGYTSIPVRTGL
jgi:cytochrome P450